MIEVIVKSQKGKCNFGHKAGDMIVIKGRTAESSVCLGALLVVMPDAYAMRYRAEFPREKDKDISHCPCLDHETLLCSRSVVQTKSDRRRW